MASSSSGFSFANVPELLRKKSAPVIHWQVQDPPPTSSLTRPRLRLSVLTTSTKSDSRSISQGSSSQSRYAYNGHSPTLPTFTPIEATPPLPLPETYKDLPCEACAERDEDVQSVDVTSPGAWSRESDGEMDAFHWEVDGTPERLTKAALALLYGQTAATMAANAIPCKCAKKTTLDLLRCQRLHVFLDDQITLRRELDADALASLKAELELAKENRRLAKLRKEEEPPAVPPKDWEVTVPAPVPPVSTADLTTASRKTAVLQDLASLPRRFTSRIRLKSMFGSRLHPTLNEQLLQNQSVDALFSPKPIQSSSALQSTYNAGAADFLYPSWPISLKIGEP